MQLTSLSVWRQHHEGQLSQVEFQSSEIDLIFEGGARVKVELLEGRLPTGNAFGVDLLAALSLFTGEAPFSATDIAAASVPPAETSFIGEHTLTPTTSTMPPPEQPTALASLAWLEQDTEDETASASTFVALSLDGVEPTQELKLEDVLADPTLSTDPLTPFTTPGVKQPLSQQPADGSTTSALYESGQVGNGETGSSGFSSGPPTGAAQRGTSTVPMDDRSSQADGQMPSDIFLPDHSGETEEGTLVGGTLPNTGGARFLDHSAGPHVEITVYKPNGFPLFEIEEQSPGPGWYINVNWDDDDGDGWTNGAAPPNANYTGDRSDSHISTGDNDLWGFDVTTAYLNQGNVRLTFGPTGGSTTFVRVYRTHTKRFLDGSSSEVTSGTMYPVGAIPGPFYMEGVSGSANFRDLELKAEYIGPGTADPDIVKVTVFDVSLIGFFGGANGLATPQQVDNDVKFSPGYTPGSSNTVGIISWDDKNGDGNKGDEDPECDYFGNVMELQGTVWPRKIAGQAYPVAFDFYREIYGRAWGRLFPPRGDGSWIPVALKPDMEPGALYWHEDEEIPGSPSPNADEDLTVNDQQHIYDTDSPGYPFKTRVEIDYAAYVADFREHVKVQLYGQWFQASAFFKWHAQWYLMPKPFTDDLLTRDAPNKQKLGQDWIAIPNNP
jgi:hypothetical protein